MTDNDDLDGVDWPPHLQFTPENVLRDLAASDADVAAGRLVPAEDVLRRLDERIAARVKAQAAAIAAE